MGMLRWQTWDDSTCIRWTDGAADRVDGTYVSPLAGNAPPGPVTLATTTTPSCTRTLPVPFSFPCTRTSCPRRAMVDDDGEGEGEGEEKAAGVLWTVAKHARYHQPRHQLLPASFHPTPI